MHNPEKAAAVAEKSLSRGFKKNSSILWSWRDSDGLHTDKERHQKIWRRSFLYELPRGRRTIKGSPARVGVEVFRVFSKQCFEWTSTAYEFYRCNLLGRIGFVSSW